MRVTELIPLLALLLSLVTMPSVLLAKTSAQYAESGKASWSAFECAIYAEKSNNKQEQERLFLYGYNQGKVFIEAAKENKINPDDASKKVPLYMGMLLSGPSTDFMLGRIYEFIADEAYEEISASSNEETSRKAKDLFWKKNCGLIGKQ